VVDSKEFAIIPQTWMGYGSKKFYSTGPVLVEVLNCCGGFKFFCFSKLWHIPLFKTRF